MKDCAIIINSIYKIDYLDQYNEIFNNQNQIQYDVFYLLNLYFY